MKTRENFPVFVQRLLTEWFPSTEDALWKEWVDVVSRGERSDIVSLLGSDVRDSFKRRALFLFVVPSREFNPLYWRGNIRLYSWGEEFLRVLHVLSSELLSYCAEVVRHFCLELRRGFCDRSKLITEEFPSVTILYNVSDKWHDVLRAYNDLILELLALLPQEEGEKLFPFYSLRDISVFSSMEDASGYFPFERLLRSTGIAEHWKIRADSVMREIIRREVDGELQPREEWENALHCYSGIVNRFVWDETSPYPVGLFEDQMRFLAERHTAEQPLIEGWKLPKLLVALSGSDKELRHKIVRMLVIERKKDGWGRFSVNGKDDAEAVCQMIQEFNDDDELVAQLRSLIEEFNAELAEDERERVEEKNRKDAILAKMR